MESLSKFLLETLLVFPCVVFEVTSRAGPAVADDRLIFCCYILINSSYLISTTIYVLTNHTMYSTNKLPNKIHIEVLNTLK